MKDGRWIVIVIVGLFLGFMIGYSVPPLMEAGMLGSDGTGAGAPPPVGEEMQEFYRDLYQSE